MVTLKKTQLFKAFWGIGAGEIRRTVIISPVVYPKRFEKISGERGRHYRTVLSYSVANFKRFTFLKTPMTQAAVHDAVVLLSKTGCQKVVFIGAIGGLRKGLKIGDVVVSKKASEIYSVKSLHDETPAKLKKLREQGVLGADFESRLFFKAAREIGVAATAYYVVTDLPLTKPFYIERTQKEADMIPKAIDKIILTTKTLIFEGKQHA